MLQILRKLKHENIIEMLDSFETPQEFCVVTEFAQVISSFLFLFSILYLCMQIHSMCIYASERMFQQCALTRNMFGYFDNDLDAWIVNESCPYAGGTI